METEFRGINNTRLAVTDLFADGAKTLVFIADGPHGPENGAELAPAEVARLTAALLRWLVEHGAALDAPLKTRFSVRTCRELLDEAITELEDDHRYWLEFTMREPRG